MMSKATRKTRGKDFSREAGPEADWIHLRRLEVRCVLGVYPTERRRARPVLLDIALACDTRRAGASDRLEDTLNYEEIEAAARAAARRGKFRLVEALAEAVARACLAHDGVRAVRVVADKPGALAHTQSVAVDIVRRQGRGAAKKR
jgi:FolB domain-containing protein